MPDLGPVSVTLRPYAFGNDFFAVVLRGAFVNNVRAWKARDRTT